MAPTRVHGVTSIDVARAAGVSQTSVSRVLNGHPGVTPKMQAKVMAAIERLGYRPNLSARSLATSRTQTVGVVLGALTNTYYAELLGTISRELGAAGYRTLIVSDRAGGAESLARTLWETNVDGIIVATTLLSPEDKERVVALQVPSVTMGPDAVDGVDAITPDNLTGGQVAAEYLADLGHTRIGVIAGPLRAASVRDRHAGFLAGLEGRGVPFDADAMIEIGDLDYRLAYDAATAMLRGPDRPTALFCHNDLVAMAALNAALAQGIPVPEELSVVGFDDVPMAAWESFRLTTVRQPIHDMASAAVELLLRRLGEPGKSERVVLPCTLVERSTAIAPTS